MKHTRFFSLILAIIFIVLAFCACNVASDEQPASGNEALTETPESEILDTEEYIAPKANYDGQDFRFYISHYIVDSYIMCHYDGISAESENADIINDALYRRNRTVEDLLNISISAEHYNYSASALINCITAADDTYSASLMGQELLGSLLGSDSYLIDLRTLDELDLNSSWFNQNANEEFTIGGHQYAALGDLCMYSTISSGCLYFSKSLLDTNNITYPYQMVYDGTWTIDNFISMAKSVSSDLNGDGIWDENDVFGMNGSPTVLMQCITSSGIRTTTRDGDVKPHMSLNSEKTINVVDKMIGLLCNPYVNALPNKFKSNDVWYDIFLPMFKNNQLLFTFNWVFYSLELRDMDTDFGLLPMPKYDESQERYISSLCSSFADYLIVPNTSKDTTMIGQVLNAMGFYSHKYVYPAVVEKTVTIKTLRDDDAAQMLSIIFNGISFDLCDIYRWDNGQIEEIWAACINGSSNVFSSKYAAIEKSIQARIDITFEKLL